MTRREAIAKATTDRTVAADGLLSPAQANAFLDVIKDSSPWGQAIQQRRVSAPTGELNKLATNARIIRAAVENTDDGYRAEPTFPTVPYSTVKVRLPYEVTEDVYHENIEGQSLEARLARQMGTQFGLDLDDLDINGDTGAGAGPDQAFLQIDDGLMVYLENNDSGQVNRVDGAAINSGEIDKAHFFAALQAMPNQYRNGNLKWLMSPARAIDWMEVLTDRETAAGDAALSNAAGPGVRPLGISILEVPFFPDDRIVLADPKNFIRVISWQIRRRKVDGTTDWELATRDKRGYIWFLKRDFIVEDDAGIVDLYDLDPIA